jgi:AraC family transcriptional regulator
LKNKPNSPKDRLLPLLIDVHTDLDDEIDLRSLASRFGASPFHFHRLFSEAIGETPRKHVERLRLEKAAYMLAVTDDPILDIGLAVGFRNPETFARNFRRHLGWSPSGYRRMAKAAQAERLRTMDFFANDAYQLTKARFEHMPRRYLLAARHLGDYGELHERYRQEDHPWIELIHWARDAGVSVEPVPIAIIYDDPTMTPAPLQRTDICLAVDRAVAGNDRIRVIELAAGTWGMIGYTGRTATLINAFRGLADEIRRSGRYTFRDGPTLEFLRDVDVDGQQGVLRLDACFAVKRVDPHHRSGSKNRQEGTRGGR